MQPLWDIAVVVLSFLARIGLPLAATALLAWVLRRLDARWKAEAEAIARQSGAPEGRVGPVRCWETKNCAPQRREKCPAYAAADKPCWQVFRQKDRHLREGCLGCEVFLRAPALVRP